VTILAVSITAVVLTVVFVVSQLLYLITLVHDLYMLARKVDWVELDEEAVWAAGPLPKVGLLYPVLREPPETMRTTFVGLDEQLQPLRDDRGSRGGHTPVGERPPPGRDREPPDRGGAAHPPPRPHPAGLRLLPVPRLVPAADGHAPARPHPGVDELPALPV
jgi:hypothetical protein